MGFQGNPEAFRSTRNWYQDLGFRICIRLKNVNMNIQSQEITHSLFIPCTTIPTTITTTNTNARTFTRMSLSHFYCCWGWEFSSPPTEEEQLTIYFSKKITFNPHFIFFIPHQCNVQKQEHFRSTFPSWKHNIYPKQLKNASDFYFWFISALLDQYWLQSRAHRL